MRTQLKDFTLTYKLKPMDFQTTIKVQALDYAQAISKAIDEIKGAYGSEKCKQLEIS